MLGGKGAMSYSITREARPQVRILLIALAVTLILGFLPFTGIITYPFRLFVTFIHEGGHAVAAVLTGSHVLGLQVAPNGSGLVYTVGGNWFSQLFVASAGYLGATAYGAALLVLIRRAVAARVVLGGTAIYVLALTIFFGLSNPFTIVAGLILGGLLFVAARYASLRLANFLVAFLAVQCVSGALFDLRTLISFSAPLTRGPQTDAANMAALTHLPPIVWALVWTAIAVVILIGALRAYATHTDAPLPSRSFDRYGRLSV
jgi:hypothetical protein